MNYQIYYIAVCESEDSETIEIPVENDDTVLLTTLGGIFPNACGLKYRAPETNTFRALKLSDGKFYKPAEGWLGLRFYCVFSKDNNKRKIDEEVEKPAQKSKRLEGKKCTDLIVLNLGWKVDEDALKKYFSKFGELVLVQVKKDRETSNSKGYAFIRFADYESQVMCLAEKHLIDGRWCAVKVPFSKNEADKQEISKKIHVGYSSEDITMEELRVAFEQYGYVTDIFIPKPFRNFAFVTFDSSDTAQALIGQTVTVNGHVLTIGSAVPKINSNSRKAMPPVHYPLYPPDSAVSAAAAMAMQHSQGFQTRYGPGIIPTYGAAWPPNYEMTATQKTNRLHNGQHHGNMGPFGGGGGAGGIGGGGPYQGMPYMVTNGNGTNNNGGGRSGPTQEAMQQELIHQHHGYMNQYGTDLSSVHNSNVAANTALNILNNPEVVAAIVAAANKSGAVSMHASQKYSQQKK